MIDKIGMIQGIADGIKPISANQQAEGASFSNLFEKMLDNVNKTEETAQKDAILVASGQTDDLHTVMINASKAELALSMFVQVRNKALDAYNEIMRMTV